MVIFHSYVGLPEGNWFILEKLPIQEENHKQFNLIL